MISSAYDFDSYPPVYTRSTGVRAAWGSLLYGRGYLRVHSHSFASRPDGKLGGKSLVAESRRMPDRRARLGPAVVRGNGGDGDARGCHGIREISSREAPDDELGRG